MRSVRRHLLVALLAVLAPIQPAGATRSFTATAGGGPTWSLLRGPSSVEFEVRHLIFSTVKGTFRRYEGTLVGGDGEDFGGAELRLSFDVRSVSTRHRDRDQALEGREFFWADRYPRVTFESRAIRRVPGSSLHRVEGTLTIRGVSQRIVLEVECLGSGEFGEWTRVDFLAKTTIDRFAFGLGWNETATNGEVLVGSDVDLEFRLAFVLDANGEKRPVTGPGPTP